MNTEIIEFRNAKRTVDESVNRAADLYIAAVQAIANKYRLFIVTGHMSRTWQVAEKWGEFRMSGDRCSRRERMAFNALTRLDEQAAEIHIGPSNMERYEPKSKGAA